MTKTLISICGPTAVGKTAMAIEVAQWLQTEIISNDSRQFYTELKIGTAPPSETELQQVKHHFIHNRSLFEDYSVGDFEREALQKLSSLFQTHDAVVMVGGSGLYERAVTEGLDEFPEVSPEIRENLNQDFAEKGIEYLQNTLQQLDPEYFQQVDIHNYKRIIRALEICIGTGKPYSSFRKNNVEKRPFEVLKIGLKMDRAMLYDRINHRVDLMMEAGLLEEAQKWHPHKELNALQTVGYREFFDYFEGKISLDFAIEEVKKNSRRFAKRQMTWFRKDATIQWFPYNDLAGIQKYIKENTLIFK